MIPVVSDRVGNSPRINLRGLGNVTRTTTLTAMSRLLARFFLCLALVPVWVRAETDDDDDDKPAARGEHAANAAGHVTGVAVDEAGHPVEFVTVALQQEGGTTLQNTATDARGRFAFEKVPAGRYVITYGRVGEDGRTTAPFVLDAKHPRAALGRLPALPATLHLEKMQVTAKAEAYLNSIDRKVYNVAQEAQSATGSASDLLQNLPAVQVDLDGNVSLRGSDNVLVLVNGRTSTLMDHGRAEALQQLPANEIERIEVITNPSARYKPDGTAGIINIVLKRKHAAGWSGTINTSAGTDRRGSVGFSANYHPGNWNVSGSASLRQDDRVRYARDTRTIVDPVTGVVTHADKETHEHVRPLVRQANLGFDYAATDHDQLGFASSYNHRTFTRRATDHNFATDGAGTPTGDYDRHRVDPEYEKSLEFSGTWRHAFEQPGHELNLELRSSATDELEPNSYTNTYRLPVQPDTADHKIFRNTERSNEAILEYVQPLADGARLEAGYTRTGDRFDANFLSEDLDPVTGRFVTNAGQTNHFIYDGTIHAFYATYAHPFGPFGVQVGLRPEFQAGQSHLVNTGAFIPNDYNRVYPSVHLSWKPAEHHEFQLNYSHRVHRPASEDLNPFPEYIDPFNLRSGNPRLKPEDIHSVEAGYAWRDDETTLTATVYHRSTNNAFTVITTDLGNAVLLTTRTNLGTSRATGAELTANTDLGEHVTLNASTNTFFNTIDASNLGFSGTKSDVSWLAKGGVTLKLDAVTSLQVNANYVSTRLTPQGSRGPTFYTNLGLRRKFRQGKITVALTVSDLFNSLKETTVVDTPLLREDIIRRRSSRIVALGLSYNFGGSGKKPKDDALKFDNAL